jgi:hypothetical protein
MGRIRRSIKPLSARGARAPSRMGFDPLQLEDENGDSPLIATTSRATSIEPIVSVVPAFWRSEKRKSPDVDEGENDANRSV